MNIGQPSRSEFCATVAMVNRNCEMPYGAPAAEALGIEDSICLLKSSSVTRIGSTHILYQGQVLH